MSLKKQMEQGLLYVEYGHESLEDQAYEKELDAKRKRIKDLMHLYNFHTLPSDEKKRRQLLEEGLGRAGKNLYLEPPCYFSYGCNTFFGDDVYANFHLVVVDDVTVSVGDRVMFGPNVTISPTGHPLAHVYRRKGAQFSLPVTIGNDVWIGANCTILPGVTIGDRCVIGAGSVVTHDIPADHLAYGTPCRVIRRIDEEDLLTYKKGFPVNSDWNK